MIRAALILIAPLACAMCFACPVHARGSEGESAQIDAGANVAVDLREDYSILGSNLEITSRGQPVGRTRASVKFVRIDAPASFEIDDGYSMGWGAAPPNSPCSRSIAPKWSTSSSTKPDLESKGPHAPSSPPDR